MHPRKLKVHINDVDLMWVDCPVQSYYINQEIDPSTASTPFHTYSSTVHMPPYVSIQIRYRQYIDYVRIEYIYWRSVCTRSCHNASPSIQPSISVWEGGGGGEPLLPAVHLVEILGEGGGEVGKGGFQVCWQETEGGGSTSCFLAFLLLLLLLGLVVVRHPTEKGGSNEPTDVRKIR